METRVLVNGTKNILSLVDWVYQSIQKIEPDPRVQDWPLMSSPWPTAILCIAYVILVKGLGPWFMKKRAPYDLRLPLIFYNGFQVVLSVWLFINCIEAGWFRNYSFTCEPVDYSYSEHALSVAGGCWWFYMAKFTEFFDTFFFVLRKKDSHISFLHAFHHGMMPMASWIMVKHVAGGHTTFEGLLNSFVHTLMYFYYMVAAMGPAYEKYLWWKQYMTNVQMIQFTLATIHNGQMFFNDCDYPKPFSFFMFVNAVFFFILFSNFYLKAYCTKRRHHGNSNQENSQKYLRLKLKEGIKIAKGGNKLLKYS